MKLWNRHCIPKDIQYTYIGRGTPWGNPYVVGDQYTQVQAADTYRKRLARQLAAKHPPATKLVLDLAGVDNICCSCTPRPCHGDCFAEIWNIIRGKGVKPLEGIRLWVKENGYPEGPGTDGINHINFYSKGKTKLGRFLTNMSDVPVNIPGHGVFESIEGYWYWLSTGMKHECFKSMNCFESKKYGSTLERVELKNFRHIFRKAMKLKLEQYPKMLELFKQSELPFKHYYHYGDHDMTVVFPPFDWLTIEWERLRKYYKEELEPCVIAGSRDITDYEIVKKAVAESGFEFNEVVSGLADGVDSLGEQYAKDHGLDINGAPADWDTHGKKAGILRNIEMGDYAKKAIVIIKNNSRGSTHMAEYMTKLGKPVHIVHI